MGFREMSAIQVGRSVPSPNILILWGDDIGYWNVSKYNQGMMGYKTPNIDRIAHEGTLFTGMGSRAAPGRAH
jgi:arylsulfatase A-like enzyme